MRRFVLERGKNSKHIKPMKITRSVGLQVLPPGNRPGNRVRPPSAGQSSRPMQQQQIPSSARSPVRAIQTQQSKRTSISPRNMVQQLTRPAIRTANVMAVPVSTTIRPQPARKVMIVDIGDDDDVMPISNPSPVRPPVPAGVRPQGVGRRIRLQSPRGRPPLQIVNPRPRAQLMVTRHPAPLPNGPPVPFNAQMKNVPPKPSLTIKKVIHGVELSWNMVLGVLDHATIASYHIFAYEEQPHQRAVSSLWRKVGDVKALPLPMACTLKQFSSGNKYHFAVRATDTHQRQGFFSVPATIQI